MAPLRSNDDKLDASGLDLISRMMVLALRSDRSIDLGELDPKNITFKYEVETFSSGASPIVRTTVQHADQMLFSSMGKLDFERLKRGWNLIYTSIAAEEKGHSEVCAMTDKHHWDTERSPAGQPAVALSSDGRWMAHLDCRLTDC